MDDLLQLGITAYKAGKRDEARKLFITAVKQNPNNEHVWGWMYQASNNDQERIHCLKQILRIDPKNEKVKQLLGVLAGNDFPFEMSQKITAPTQEQKYSTPPDTRKNNKKTPKSAGKYLATGIGVILLIGIILVGILFMLQNQGMPNLPTKFYIPILMPKPLTEFSYEDLQKSILTPNDLTFRGLYPPSAWKDCTDADAEQRENYKKYLCDEMNLDVEFEVAFQTFLTSEDCSERIGTDRITENIFLFSDTRIAQRFAENIKYKNIGNFDSNFWIKSYTVNEIKKDGYYFWILRNESSVEISSLVIQVDEVVIDILFLIYERLVIDDLLEVGIAAIKNIRSVQR